MIETVFALLLIMDHEIKEHRIQPSLSKCLKAKRIAMRDKNLLIELFISVLNLKQR